MIIKRKPKVLANILMTPQVMPSPTVGVISTAYSNTTEYDPMLTKPLADMMIRVRT